MNHDAVSKRARATKFLSYYRPYLKIFIPVLVGAFAVSATTVVLPLYVRYMTKTVLAGPVPNALAEIYRAGAAMLVLTVVQMLANMFVFIAAT
jgi:ATP-binding cassette subfamily B protein